MSDNLRDRIAHLLHRHFELTAIGPVGCGHEYWSDEEHVAQAIIYELGLTTETHAATHAKRTMTRITGQWEWEN